MGLHIGYKCKCQQNLVLQLQIALGRMELLLGVGEVK